MSARPPIILEGVLNGHLNVTQANTQDSKSWFGNGQVDLRNGLIWEIPIFGVLSPVLDSVITPGLGESRLNQASATFVMTNSVLRSDDLLLRSPTVRLLYRGTVGFDMQVDATVEAEVGRDAPLVGSLVSTVFMPFGKLFETKVTGSLSNPKRAPVMFAAKLITPFIHPLRTLKELFPGESNTGTNFPPANPPANPPGNAAGKIRACPKNHRGARLCRSADQPQQVGIPNVYEPFRPPGF